MSLLPVLGAGADQWIIPDSPNCDSLPTARNERWRSGVPLGGIGCGKIDLLTDGAFGNFTINHNWDRPTRVVRGSFFAFRQGDETTLLRLKRAGEYENAKNISDVSYTGLFPRAIVKYGGLPVELELEAFSPLIPQNAEDSSLPVTFFTFRLRSEKSTEASLLFSWENLLGWGGRQGVEWNDRSGNASAPVTVGSWSGLRFTTAKGKPDNVTGEYLILSDGEAKSASHWDSSAGMIERSVSLRAGETATVRFAAAWFMPHLVTQFRWCEKLKEPMREVDARAALGEKPNTAFRTRPPTIPGEEIVFDLGEVKSLDRFVIKNQLSQGDFTHGFALDASSDGEKWELVEHKREKVRNGTAEFSFPSREARYLKLKQTKYGPDWQWNASEAAAWSGQERVAIQSARARIHSEKWQTAKEDVGHYYLNRFPTSDALSKYAVENVERLDRETREWQDLIMHSSLPEWLRLMLLNHSFPAFSNTVFTKDGRFSILESPVTMGGALGTMDQRMASHGFWTMMFPDLDRRELELYAAAQDRVRPVADGRIPHFCGNVHESIGDPGVGYGTTDWPDLSCSWLMQVCKWYRWTGDREFFDRMWPHAKRVYEWLEKQDTDGDLIPAGGSTYDYEHLPRGAYIYSASCYLGALRAGAEMARQAGEKTNYAERFRKVQASVIDRLWDPEQGTFIKWRGGDKSVKNSFVAPLAGDWLTRLTGLEGTLPADKTESTIRETLARHAKSFYPIPPMEVEPDGKIFTRTCFVLQHEPFLGCEAIYLGYLDDGLDVIKRVYTAAWDLNHSPWDLSLMYNAPGGRQSGLLTYMTACAVWHVLPALTGTTVDMTSGNFVFKPNAAYQGPLFFPGFWLWIDCSEGHATAKVIKVFKAGAFTKLNGIERRLEVKQGAVWDLSEFAKLPKSKSAPVRFARNSRNAPKNWRVKFTAGGSEFDPAPIANNAAIDGDHTTRWTTQHIMQPGDCFEVDLLESHDLKGVVLDTAASPNDWPRGVRVETSEDGASWKTAAELDEEKCSTDQQKGVLKIRFESRARHIRLTQLGKSDRWWWSIYEFDIVE